MIKTVTTTAGVNTVTFPEFFKYFWIKNIGDATVYASAFADVGAGVDNSSVINAGDAVCIENVDNNDVYISGAGSVEIHAQDYPDCSFKLGTKGGEIPDLSEYAKTADVPNIKVNAAVNADNVGGKDPEKIFYENGVSSDLDSATESGCYAASPDTLNVPYSSWWVVDTMNYNGQFIVQKAHTIGNTANTISYIRNYANNAWSDWTEMYTLGNKPYVTGSATVAANSQICVTNHGFMPSAAIWWDSNGSNGVAVSFDDSQFIINVISTDKMTINYMIFK